MTFARPPLTRRGLTASIAALAVASLAHPLGARQADAEKAVLQALAQLNDAFQRADVKAYDALTTPDFVRVGGNGRVSGKASWLQTVVANTGLARRPRTFDETSEGRKMTRAGRVAALKAPPAASAPPPAQESELRLMVKGGAGRRPAHRDAPTLVRRSPAGRDAALTVSRRRSVWFAPVSRCCLLSLPSDRSVHRRRPRRARGPGTPPPPMSSGRE